MSALLERDRPGDDVTDPCEATFDPSAYFDRWLADVQAANDQPYTDADQEQEIYVESRIGSNCEVTFEGVLHFDGYSMGNVLSPSGTLVLTRRGRIEADIEVGIAIIDGSVTGNITASERVVLESDARVKGQIFTPALSMRLGAILDGDCLFVTPERQAEQIEAIVLGSPTAFQLDDPVLSAELSGVLSEEPDEELEEFLLSA
ncbi:MAG TPA: polymer-forming cytoskeletal protein [Pyrinomonadaceae bacterium]